MRSGSWSAACHVAVDDPYDLGATLRSLRQGPRDPTLRVSSESASLALRTQDGPALLELSRVAGGVAARALGPGTEAALLVAPALVGAADDPAALVARHPAVRDAQRHRPGLRLSAGTPVSQALVWAVLAQKVVAADACHAYRALAGAVSDAAPGGTGLLLPPAPERLAETPSWVFHRCNVERRRARVIVDCCRRATRLDSLAGVAAAEARERLQSIPGVGPWTAAVVTSSSHGDPDAVPLRDLHIPNLVAWALAGEARGDDERMLELLEPYAGQRGRVIRLLTSGGRHAPRWGPRLPRQSIAGL
ncbi:MAG: DNA-3-methyladenine glycosylase family protein [Candidatus Dormibacteria bacterium]